MHGNQDQGTQEETALKEMYIEFFWQKKDFLHLKNFKSTLMDSPMAQYRIYYLFLVIEEESERFDEALKKVMEISDREWRSQLPNYVDRAQFESLVLF